MAKKLSEDEIAAICANQIELAKKHNGTEREPAHDKALDYYLGNMNKYVPPEANRSKVVSRDVADTIGWLLPDIMRVFTGSDRMAIAEPGSDADREFATQATEGMNYVFWKDNDGYATVYNATWDALLDGNGIIKTYYDDTPVYSTSFYSDLNEDQVALLLQPNEDGEEPEVLAQSPHVDAMGVPLWDLKIKRKVLSGTFIIEAIPPEEFLIDGDAITTTDAAFTDHWQKKTRSALVAMGYDKDEVWKIPEAGKSDSAAALARSLNMTTDANDESMQLVDYHECFIRIDVDGDGEAELIRACHGGATKGVLLDWEVWEDEHPFDDIPCEPIPHRWAARSVADKTIDIQDVNTVLTRQLLNNTYWVNNPQRQVAGKVKNPEQLDNPTFGGTVYTDAGTVITDLPRPYIGDKALQALAYMGEVRQSRTGVSRHSMALDPETLQNQTATSSQHEHDASHSHPEQIARNMAEFGWTKVFRKLLKLMVKHQEYARKVMVNDKKEITIDPRQWNADMKVTINTGLGTGSRDRDLQMLGTVLNSQLMLADRFMAAGATEDAIELLPKIIQTMTKMAESAGIRNPEDFYPEYTEEKVAQLKQLAAQPKPDPAIALEQLKGANAEKLKGVDAQVSMHAAELKAQGDVVKNQAELDADLQTKEADRVNAIALEHVTQGYEDRRFFAKLAQERELALAQMNLAEQETDEKGEDGKPKKAVKSKADIGNETLMQGMAQNTQAVLAAVKQITDSMNRPKSVTTPDGRTYQVN